MELLIVAGLVLVGVYLANRSATITPVPYPPVNPPPSTIDTISGAVSTVASALQSAVNPPATTYIAPSPAPYVAPPPPPDSTTWYSGVAPGTIYYNGQPQPNLTSSGPSAAQSGLGFAGQGAGVLGATGAGAAHGIFGSGAMASGTTLGSALPIIGAGISIAATVLGLIAAHHKAALAKEGSILNTVDPRVVTVFALIIQGVVKGEITSSSQAQGLVSQAISDWYTGVSSIQRGTWHYTGQDMSADYQKVWIQRFQPPAGAPGFSDYHAPDPCNASCVVGHFFVERSGFLVMAGVIDALQGHHGVVKLPAIPPHSTQNGLQEVDVYY